MKVVEASSTIDGFQGMNNSIVYQILYSISSFPHIKATDSFESKQFRDFCANNWQIPIISVVLYLLLIIIGPKVMAQRGNGYELKIPLVMWNAFLCVFSFIGMWKTMPFLLGNILSMSFKDTVCADPTQSWGEGDTGLWSMLFAFSKLFELLDTLFIVLRKRPLLFLHWYHHVTVLLFCWSAYSTLEGSGLYFIAMNFSIHAVMYGYYCLQALKVCPNWFPVAILTLFQVVQMIIGTGICIACWYYKLSGQDCHASKPNLIAAAAMYGSYLYLFCDFAFRRYLQPKNSKKTE